MTDNDDYAIVPFKELKGKTLTNVRIVDNMLRLVKDYKSGDGHRIIFDCSDGSTYQQWHQQDCCEDVTIDDICGDLQDIIGSPIIRISETSNNKKLRGKQKRESYGESFTYTFYKIDTINGGVTIRWYGSSNGWYSEEVTTLRIKGPKDEDETEFSECSKRTH